MKKTDTINAIRGGVGAEMFISKRHKKNILPLLITVLLAITFMLSFVGCRKQYDNKYNNKYNAAILYSEYKFREGFLQENVTRGSYGHYWDENRKGCQSETDDYSSKEVDDGLPKTILRVINTEEEADAVFSELPEDVDFEKHTVCVYVFTTTCYRQCLVKMSSLQNGILSIYFDFEKNENPKAPGATMPRSKHLVIKVDKVNADKIEIVKMS